MQSLKIMRAVIRFDLIVGPEKDRVMDVVFFLYATKFKPSFRFFWAKARPGC